jgi:sRNA-binding carbon storage regulator CsrA
MGLRLGRRIGESLVFHTAEGEVRVTVLSLRTLRDGVNLMIEAPASMKVLRGELESRPFETSAPLSHRSSGGQPDGS